MVVGVVTFMYTKEGSGGREEVAGDILLVNRPSGKGLGRSYLQILTKWWHPGGIDYMYLYVITSRCFFSQKATFHANLTATSLLRVLKRYLFDHIYKNQSDTLSRKISKATG